MYFTSYLKVNNFTDSKSYLGLEFCELLHPFFPVLLNLLLSLFLGFLQPAGLAYKLNDTH